MNKAARALVLFVTCVFSIILTYIGAYLMIYETLSWGVFK